MKKFTVLALMIGLMATPAIACTINGEGGFVPENDLYIPVNAKGITTGLTEEQFNKTIDKVEGIYAPIITSMGGNLKVARNWSDGTVNAYASQAGSIWNVAMFGGLARHDAITEDGFALVICHEIGHHIGGAPKKTLLGGGGGGWWGGGDDSRSPKVYWASNEGQADYFATLKCLRRVFLNEDNARAISTMTIPAPLRTSCESTYKGSSEDINICIRTAMAGDSVARMFQSLRKEPKAPAFDTPDTKVVTKTDDNHPATQCRMDTYFQGSICDVDFREDVSQTDETVAVCHPLKGHTKGNRPTCWFKAKTASSLY